MENENMESGKNGTGRNLMPAFSGNGESGELCDGRCGCYAFGRRKHVRIDASTTFYQYIYFFVESNQQHLNLPRCPLLLEPLWLFLNVPSFFVVIIIPEWPSQGLI